jgi:hypothetical protein
VLPAKQANIIFDPFAHSIINVTTMVDGDGIIASRITHRHHRRLYHKFSICTRTNEYLFNMPFIAHSVLNVFRVYIFFFFMVIGDEEYLPRMLTIMMTMMIGLLTSTND